MYCILPVPEHNNVFFRLHVRRTDKSIEDSVQYQHLENYMIHAMKWYQCNFEEKGIKVEKKIYLATDEPDIIAEAKTK